MFNERTQHDSPSPRRLRRRSRVSSREGGAAKRSGLAWRFFLDECRVSVGRCSLALAASLLAGCASYVEQRSPEENEGVPQAPATFAHGGEAQGNKAVSFGADQWWRVYGDMALNSLMLRLSESNPDLQAALARVDQSHAALGVTRGPLLPTVTSDASAGRRRDAVNNLLFPIATPEYERYRLGMSASWELDLWGRVRGAVRRDSFRAEAAELDYQAVLLSMQGDLARQYFAARTAMMELAILREAHELRSANLQLQESRLELGSGVEIDVSRARVELNNARAAEEAAVRNLGRLRHGIAALIGQAPSEFDIDLSAGTSDVKGDQLRVPLGVPSELLIRRADVRAADRNFRAAAVQVGIRKADFLPRITLNGSGGVASLKTSNLFDAGSGFFDVGPQVDVPLFQSGRRRSSVEEAKALWREAAAGYRGALLNAVREVDDALLDLKSLGREAGARRDARVAAERAAVAARDRHESGLASYFEFIEAERDRLQAKLADNALKGEQRAASVNLIQALGGGWRAKSVDEASPRTVQSEANR